LPSTLSASAYSSIGYQQLLKSVEQTLSYVEQIPEIPGHEKLLMDMEGHSRFAAKLLSLYIHRLGQKLADEINIGRRLSRAAGKVVQVSGRSTLVRSRRAKDFLSICQYVESQNAIEEAAVKANLAIQMFELFDVIELACARDESACDELEKICIRLMPYLPEKRGRPISVETCIHSFLLRHLERNGRKLAYTYSDDAKKSDGNGGDFVDEPTAATRLASNNRKFSPLHAHKLRNDRKIFPLLHPAPSAIR
jgi:hypothetical protein